MFVLFTDFFYMSVTGHGVSTKDTYRAEVCDYHRNNNGVAVTSGYLPLPEKA